MYGILPGSMAFVVMAADALLFLVAWEAMALSCYFLLVADHDSEEVRSAGTLYIIATHTCTLFLIAMFALLYQTTGSFVFPSTGSMQAATPVATVVFSLALIGFGAKAGLMPLHVWLPSAHANAPSHSSAIMSGVILKMGVYGIIRTVTFFDTPPLWWGLLLLVMGVISAVAGVAFALGQHDLKRLLAYHSIENIGIIFMGIGTGMAGLALGKPLIALLGFAGGLLHLLNHAIFKALLFLGAGAVIHASGTRDIDRTGGLIRVMPKTALFFLVGSMAICGLPPLNGFASELLVYLGMFRQVIGGSALSAALPALAIPALALVGGLAVACFVKVFGVVFLGAPRRPLPGHPEEPGPAMLAPMAPFAESETWGCGYLAPTPRMQYTASSFADFLVSLFSVLLRPGSHRPTIEGPAPERTGFSSHVPEAVLDLVIMPLLRRTEHQASILRHMQHGKLHLYMLYIVVVLFFLMAWAVLWPIS